MGPPSYKTELEPIFSSESLPCGSKLCKLNKFLKSASQALPTDLDKDQFISSIPKDTYFANLTRLELATILKRAEPIFDTWKSENTTLLYHSLRILWIFKDSSVSPLLSNPDFVVDTLFPSLSQECRTRVSKQMGKLCIKQDAEAVTTIYHKLLDKYGVQLAQNLIPACNQSLIDSLIEGKRIKFDHNQFLALYKKYPESGIKYLQVLYDELQHSVSHHRGNFNQFFTHRDSCPAALRFLARSNPLEFMNLFEKYDSALSSLSLGRKLTNYLIQQDKPRIISGDKATAYASLLCTDTLCRRLTEPEFENFFIKLFPKNLKAFQTMLEMGKDSCPSLFVWLEKYPRGKRFEKLETSFKSCYGKNLLDFPEYVSSRLIQLMSPDSRDKWVDFRLSHPDPGNQWIFNLDRVNIPGHWEAYWEAFRATDKSIPKIKQYLATGKCLPFGIWKRLQTNFLQFLFFLHRIRRPSPRRTLILSRPLLCN